MAEIVMIKCDNPKCNKVGPSETELYGKTSAKRRRPMAPPYGWIIVDGGVFGCGPTFKNVIVCTTPCLGPAIDQVIYESEDR